MPEMDGQQVLRAIREFESARGVPGCDRAKVIMTTALGDRENVVQAADSDIAAYLLKPIDRQGLMEEIRSLGLLG